MKNQKEESRKYAVIAALAADSKKAEDVKIVDVGDYSPITDFVVLVTASSTPQINAVDEEIETKLKEAGVRKLYGDGAKTDMWRVADYGGFIIHVLNRENRDFYALDKLFAFGEAISWEEEPADKKPAAKSEKTVKAKSAAKEPASSLAQKIMSGKLKKPASKTVKPTAKKATAKPAVKKTAKPAAKKTAAKKAKK